MKEQIKNEPVVTGGALGGGLVAIILGLMPQFWALLASYGLEVTPELERFVAALLAIIVPSVAAYIARNYVTPVNKLK